MISTMHQVLFFLIPLVCAVPAAAQGRDQDQALATPSTPSIPSQTRQGETAHSAAGQVGLRQSREQLAIDTGIEPMGRINGRIQNRVQARIRNRIDRYYDPRANATSPFAVASEQATALGRSRR